jgi:hypothetical protein
MPYVEKIDETKDEMLTSETIARCGKRGSSRSKEASEKQDNIEGARKHRCCGTWKRPVM